jgi:preprotein translocase subunit SecG
MLLFLLKFVLLVLAVVVIVIVMLQKGKGGGLAGALGGAGGQSAFGTKAGDLFTKITIGVATVWIVLCVIAAMAAPYLTGGQLDIAPAPGAGAPQNPGQPAPPSGDKPADEGGKAGSPEKSSSVPEPPSNPPEQSK